MANDATTAVELKTADGVPIRPGMLVYVPNPGSSRLGGFSFQRGLVAADPNEPGRCCVTIGSAGQIYMAVLVRSVKSRPLDIDEIRIEHVHSSASSFMRGKLEEIDERLRGLRLEIEETVAEEEAARAALVGV